LPAIGKAAGAKHLVMSHYTPIPQSPLIYLEKATKAAELVGYAGKIIAPTELDQIEI
jgi:ribonuclease BN (tRNA processing enzyme)